MADLNVKEDRFDSRYSVTEKGTTFEMSFSWYDVLRHHIHKTYHHLYNENTGGVYAWYRSLTLSQRKEIRVQGRELDNGFYPDSFYED